MRRQPVRINTKPQSVEHAPAKTGARVKKTHSPTSPPGAQLVLHRVIKLALNKRIILGFPCYPYSFSHRRTRLKLTEQSSPNNADAGNHVITLNSFTNISRRLCRINQRKPFSFFHALNLQ
ncbi:hypothetical protein AUJ14_01580 [Candidatus Micrarchaeota archaeon CG1_02_55_22]|nr:MAG: hypothetical protein AUJ14_01580 [Candidatus Micrarchaeota archaeon CG1_02_55_22]